MFTDKYAAGDKTRAQQPDGFEPDSSGMVLVVVVILAAVAGVLAAGLHFASGSRITQARQEMRFEKAFFVAEAGIERAKAELRYRADDLNSVLIGADGVTNTADDGVLSFGSPTYYGEGRFYVKVRNNTNNPTAFVNTNHIVIIRATGIVETAIRAIEVEIQVTPLEMSPQADGSLGIYGTNADLAIGGSGALDGHDYDWPSDFDCTGGGCDGETNANPAVPGVYSATTNITFPNGTNAISGVPPVTNGVSANGYTETSWLQFVNALTSYATVYSNGAYMGYRTNPVVTMLLPGVITEISGGNKVAGAGILIIPATATLKVSGTFHYEGMIILVGDGVVDIGDEFSATGTVDIFGSIVCVGGALDLNVWGNSNIKYCSAALSNLVNISFVPAPMDVFSWQEIKASSTGW